VFTWAAIVVRTAPNCKQHCCSLELLAAKNNTHQFLSGTSMGKATEIAKRSGSFLNKALVLVLAVFPMVTGAFAQDSSELIVSQLGDLPVVISAPHGGNLEIQGVPPREGEGLEAGPAGFRVVRDGGTEELALEVARQLAERMKGRPSFVISRVHRRYVDFNRPPEIAVEHALARVVYDQYHTAVADAIRTLREKHMFGLLIDIHGQGSSAETVYRGTSNGLTMSGLRKQYGEEFHAGENSLLALLKKRNWKVHPDPFDGKEQAGFTGGHIVRTYGSHRSDGIDAIQLELGGNYRKTAVRERIAREMAEAIAEHIELVTKAPEKTSDQKPLQLKKE
jgi:N-formylglutamate amidohydrolase